MIGDFNVNILSDATANSNFSNLKSSYIFLSFITESSKVPSNDSNSPPLFDHIWYNRTGNFISGVITFDITDHLPTFFQLPLLTPNNTSDLVRISFRCLNEANVISLVYTLIL